MPGWLQGWGARRQIKIDRTKILSDLTDFPVLLRIASTCGSNGYDLTSIFDDLQFSSGYENDTFTGDDGSIANTDRWTTVNTTYGRATIQANALKLYYTQSTSGEWTRVKSRFRLAGNFDVQVDFSNLIASNSDSYIEFILRPEESEDFDYANIQAGYIGGSSKFRCGAKVANATLTTTEASRVNSSGRFRMVRTGTTLKVYYKDGADDEVMIKQYSWHNMSVFINLALYCSTSGSPSGYFDNFTVNSCTKIDWYMNCQRIAVCSEDGTTQLYAEVEEWDSYLEQALIWVKIPTVYSATDTIFYVYYDKTHAINSTYIGLFCSSAAREVWANTWDLVLNGSPYSFYGNYRMNDSSPTAKTFSTSSSGVDYFHISREYGRWNYGFRLNSNSNHNVLGYAGSALHPFEHMYGTTQSFTFAMWVKFKTLDTTGARSVFGVSSNMGGGRWGKGIVVHDGSNRCLKFYIEDTVPNQQTYGANWQWNTDQWYHIVGVVDRTAQRVTLYLNGAQHSQSADITSLNIRNYDTNVVLGSWNTTDVSNDFYIDNIRVRLVATSEAEAKALYYSENDALLLHVADTIVYDFGSSPPSTEGSLHSGMSWAFPGEMTDHIAGSLSSTLCFKYIGNLDGGLELSTFMGSMQIEPWGGDGSLHSFLASVQTHYDDLTLDLSCTLVLAFPDCTLPLPGSLESVYSLSFPDNTYPLSLSLSSEKVLYDYFTSISGDFGLRGDIRVACGILVDAVDYSRTGMDLGYLTSGIEIQVGMLADIVGDLVYRLTGDIRISVETLCDINASLGVTGSLDILCGSVMSITNSLALTSNLQILTGSTLDINGDLFYLTGSVENIQSGDLDILGTFYLEGQIVIEIGRVTTSTQVIVMNTATNSLGRYSSYPYRSFTTYKDKPFGSVPGAQGGIYLLEGDDDNGTEIDAYFSTPTMDVSLTTFRRLVDAWITGRKDGKLTVRVIYGEAGSSNTTDQIPADRNDKADEFRFKLPKGMNSRYYSFVVSNYRGSDFDIDRFRVTAVKTDRRR